ncbi:MAG: alkene reductase [Planctomycetota bacterium]
MMNTRPSLLSPVSLGDLHAPNRVFMAPLTRSRAKQPGDIPWAMNAEYYAQRATSGLIIAEATPVCPEGKGYAFTPGIWTDEQAEGWKLVTDRVHAAGGRIWLQLWHVGRVSHVALQPNGQKPVAPSAVRAQSQTYIDDTYGRADTSEPRALETDEVPKVIEQFRHGATLAKAAGFDGVEVHGANSYLLDQFCRDGTNLRDDEWGGPIENRTKLGIEVARAVAEVWGVGRVGYRISPFNEANDLKDSTPDETFGYLADKLGELGLAYLHAVERPLGDPSAGLADANERFARLANTFRAAGGGGYIANCGYTPELGQEAVASGYADAVAFGKLFISNPDLPERIRRDGPYRDWDRDTFYGGGPVGYTDQPPLAEPAWSSE